MYFVKELVEIPKVNPAHPEIVYWDLETIAQRLIYQGESKIIAEALAEVGGTRVIAHYERDGKSVRFTGAEYYKGKHIGTEMRVVPVAHSVKQLTTLSHPESDFKPLQLTPEEKKYLVSLKVQ